MGRSTDNGVTFFINRQMLDTEGKRSIHGNIVINGDRRKFSTGLRISEKIWDAKCNQAKGRSPEAQRINISLIKIREIIENLKTDLLLKDGFISAITVRDAYVELSKTPEKRAKEEAIKKVKEEEERRKIEEERERKELEEIGITLLEYFDTYIDSRRKEVEAGELTHVTYGRYLCTRNRLILFMLEEIVYMLSLKHIRLRIDTHHIALLLFLKLEGLHPLFFLKNLLKWLSSVNPSSSAISFILI